MLIRFGVSNFRSINDYQELLLTASKLKGGTTSLIHSAQSKEALLPSVVIYGANASGKSNVVQALDFFVKLIINSHVSGKASGGLERDVFLLDPTMKNEVSEFDADFIANDIRYHYGFKINDQEIVEEWLYAYPKKVRQVWFHRNSLEEEPFYFGKPLKGKNKTIASMTRANSLFLSSAAQNNHEQLSGLYQNIEAMFLCPNTIEADIVAMTQPGILATQVKGHFQDETLKNKVMSFLTHADTGISDIKFNTQSDHDSSKLTQEEHVYRDIFKSAILRDNPDMNDADVESKLSQLSSVLHNKLEFIHQSSHNNGMPLAFEAESLGTKHLLTLLFPVFKTLETGGVLVIDEIDTSMHPLLAIKLVELFDDHQSNPKGAQLIYTTHDTNILANPSMRRDQVWFVEKGHDGASTLYPLSDIHTREGDPFEKNYLQGRFGAIPFLGGLHQAMTGGQHEKK